MSVPDCRTETFPVASTSPFMAPNTITSRARAFAETRPFGPDGELAACDVESALKIAVYIYIFPALDTSFD